MADAKVSDQLIDLTRNLPNQPYGNSAGGVFYDTPLQLLDKKTGKPTSFTTHFSFTFGAVASPEHFGNGLAFFLASTGSVINMNNIGGGFGLFKNNASDSGIIAVEFDTFQNEWDRDNNHIGIDVYSVVSVSNISCNPSLWTWMITHSQPCEAWVRYDSSSLNLSVELTCSHKNLSCETYNLHYIIDLTEYLPEKVTVGFSAGTAIAWELHQLNSWEFNSNLEIKNSNKMVALVGLVVGGGLAVVISVLGLFLFIRRRKKHERKVDDDDDVILDVPMGPREFTFAELARATRDFDEEQKLGEGRFGGVYRGFLSDINKDIAVKRISKGSKHGTKEYASEVKIISRLWHRKLVQLFGWCHQKKELLLVYEFLSNGSLDFHLFQNRGSLAWDLRYKIILDLASTSQYLHEEWEQCVVHRDIKSNNVILDTHFNAKLGDFGLARLVEHEEEYLQATIIAASNKGDNTTTLQTQTTNIAGTMGYMAPEYLNSGKATKESDIYSFGIVLLEIACGRRPMEIRVDLNEVNLVNWVWELYGTQKHLEAADSSQGMDFDKRLVERLIVVGLWCAHPDPKHQPSIKEASHVLQFAAALPILPPKRPMPTNIPPLPFNMSTFSIASSQPSSSSGTTSSSKLNKSSVDSSSPAISLLSNPR